MATLATDRAAAAAPPKDSTHRRRLEPFWNWPNTITVVRTAAVPILLLLPFFPGRAGSQAIGWCFIVAALSDLLDCWLARRGQMVTHVGKLLDPLADKLIVSTALIVMLAMGRIPLWATWMVVVIVGLELAVTGLRGIASADGHVMAASPAGKTKALVQNFAVGALIFHETTLGLPAHTIGMTLLALATALTLLSGYAYFASYFRTRNAAIAGEEASHAAALAAAGAKGENP
jgi:CDP-diacylglycerol--glycerol-3-phosphate 3-phosphatidyltransferase